MVGQVLDNDRRYFSQAWYVKEVSVMSSTYNKLEFFYH